MRITRRHCFYLGAGMVLTGVSLGLAAVPAEEQWRAVCRHWMHVLLPDDERGSGADSPSVWSRLEKRMDANPSLKRWLMMGFKTLGNTKVPKDERELDALLGENTPLTRFIDFLRIELIEDYYGTESGWRDLGFLSTPLP